ncbi:MAG: pantoate--beta-alanine ligase [Ekhidna sp.]
MRSISSISELKNALNTFFNKKKSIGFAPTMGALHQGHLSLVNRSTSENDISVVSIFVNPLQFNNESDLNAYPRVIEDDLRLLEQAGVDIAFIPEREELYPQKPSINIGFGEMEKVLEGEYRPGHFGGVGLVVSKLFNLVQPDRAYFGLKDLQQFLLIKKMVHDLNFQVEIIGVDTVREESGLAMSSRNRRLSDKGIDVASNIYRGLKLFEKGVLSKDSLTTISEEVLKFYNSIHGLEIEYFQIVDPVDLKPLSSYPKNELAACVAGYVEGVRLIDNLYLQLK